MSDEQRKREREKELRRQVREPWLAFSEKHREHLNTNELFFLREGYEAAWLARDAEVQRRLLTALGSMVAEFDPTSENEIAAHKNAVMLLAEYLPEKEAADAD